jgi:hypothetical protein
MRSIQNYPICSFSPIPQFYMGLTGMNCGCSTPKEGKVPHGHQGVDLKANTCPRRHAKTVWETSPCIPCSASWPCLPHQPRGNALNLQPMPFRTTPCSPRHTLRSPMVDKHPQPSRPPPSDPWTKPAHRYTRIL